MKAKKKRQQSAHDETEALPKEKKQKRECTEEQGEYDRKPEKRRKQGAEESATHQQSANVEIQQDGVLPDDVPLDHEAHRLCNMQGDGVGRKRGVFYFKTPEGGRVAFQLSLADAGGSEELCLRVLRACYVKFEEGWEKPAVVLFRKACLFKLGVTPNNTGARSGSRIFSTI